MYLMSKSDHDAKRMVLIPIVGSLIGPLVWFIPAMAATVLHPHLATEFPTLKAPNEAAFVAVAMQVMPTGLIGLLISAMLGATLTNMDAGVNKGVGVFVRSFYLPQMRPKATESELLRVSKLCTLGFGAIIVLVAVEFSRLRTMNLFDLVNQLSASLTAPLAIPLVLGIIYKRTPRWSAWSTALVGFVVATCVNALAKPELFQHLLGYSMPLNKQEGTDMMLGATVILTFTASIAWFFFTGIFYRRESSDGQESIERFFEKLATPVVADPTLYGHNEPIVGLLANLCCAYGGFILLLMLIPNSLVGRLCFTFCGGVILAAGLILSGVAKRDRPVDFKLEGANAS